MSGELSTEIVRRDPDERDDLAAIVRYHGANEAIDALLVVAAEAYGKDAAVENLHRLMLLRAERFYRATCKHRWEYGDDARYCPGCDAVEPSYPPASRLLERHSNDERSSSPDGTKSVTKRQGDDRG